MHRFCVWLVLLHDAIYWQALCNNCYAILRKKFKAWITGMGCSVWLMNSFVGMPHYMAEPVWLVNRMRVTTVEKAVPKGVLGGEGGAQRSLCPGGEARK